MRALALLLATLAACSSPDGSPDLAGVVVDMGDDAAIVGPADFASTDLALSGTYAGPFTLPVGTNIAWDAASGETPVTAVHITNGRGTITFDGTDLPAVVYQKIPFDPYTLAAVAATTSDGILITYVYCENGALNSIHSETLSQPLTLQFPLQNPGSCAFVDGASAGDVTFDRPTTLTYGPLVDLADIDGALMHLHGGQGTYTIAGTNYAVQVFSSVDCTAQLCGGAGWKELHATIRLDNTLAFGIFYLRNDKPTEVQLAYGVRFDTPSLWPPDKLFPASWTLK